MWAGCCQAADWVPTVPGALGAGAQEAGGCCREFPKQPLGASFFSFFLKYSSYSSPLVQTSTWPFTQPSLPFSQEYYSRPGGRWAWGCSHPDPCTGPRDLIVLNSPYHLIFQCPLQFLVSNLHICWDILGCSLCSSEDQLGVSPVHRGKRTPLPPLSLQSSLPISDYLIFLLLFNYSCLHFLPPTPSKLFSLLRLL